MRFAPLLPVRRPAFGRRIEPVAIVAPIDPTSEDRRLIDRIIRRKAPHRL